MFYRDHLSYCFHYNATILFVVFDLVVLKCRPCCSVDSGTIIFLFSNQTPYY